MFNSGEEYVYTLRQKCYSFGSWFVGMSGRLNNYDFTITFLLTVV